MKTPTHRPPLKPMALGLLLLAVGAASAATGTGSTTADLDMRDYTLAVTSAHGSPVPAVGTNTYAWRAAVTASVEAAVNAGGTNYTCTGWIGSGSIPATGATNTTGAIILTNVASSLAWQWSAAATDTDADGLPDAWETAHFGNLTTSDGTGDFDGDGRTDAQEFADGTDPANAGSTLGLVACYPFDGNANDASGNGNATTVVGAQFESNALRFDGVDDWLELNNNTISTANDFAISFRMNLAGGYAGLFNQFYQTGAYDNRWTLFVDAFTIRVGIGEFSSGVINRNYLPMSIASNQNQHVVLTYQRPVLSLAVNGQITSVTLDAQEESKFAACSHQFRFSEYSNHGIQRFNGLLDDVRIYNRALSSNEVSRLYASTAPQPPPRTVTLHPGAHGSIAGANSGSNYVVTVTNGAAFPAVTVVTNAGWTFTGWDPPAPATVTNDFEATAVYEAVAQARFQLVRGSFTWHQAKADAEAHGGHLATLVSEVEWQRMLNDVGSAANNESLWLGATDEETEGVWKWVTGEPWGFTRWYPGEPNDALDHEDYLEMYSATQSFLWYDAVANDIWNVGYVLEVESGAQPRPDLAISSTDLRILNASGAQTWNPALGETVTLEVTVHNPGETNTTGDVLVQLFLDGAPTNLVSYSTNAFPVVTAASVAESIGVGASRTVLIPWIVSGSNRVATLSAVAEFATNRAQSQANAQGASGALPVAEVSLANNVARRSLQIGSPASGGGGIAVRCSPPTGLESGARYTLSGTAVYDWGTREPVLGARVTVTVNSVTYGDRTALPDSAWSVLLNGLPAGVYPLLVQVDDGQTVGSTNLTLTVSPGPQTVDLSVRQMDFFSGAYRVEGETGYAVTGTVVTLRALVRNDGNSNAVAFAVAFKDPAGDVLCTVPVSGLAAFSETWVTATAGWPAQTGVSTLTAVADSTNGVAESNEGNNTRSCTVVGTAARPDLVVAALSIAPGAPTEGVAATLTATIRNQGAAAVTAGTVLATTFSPGGIVTTNLATDLPTLGTVTVSAPYTFATAGAYAVTVTADSGDAVPEIDEQNNVAALGVTVRRALPDLRPFYYLYGSEYSWNYRSGLSFSPAQPAAGEAVTASCDIYNVGTVPLVAGKSFNTVFSAGGTPFATNRLTLAEDLAVGASVRVAIGLQSGAAGQTNVTVTVDPAGEVDEENKANNGTSAGLTVYPVVADLVAAGLSFSPLQPLPDTPVVLTAHIRNDGGTAGGAGALVEFFKNSTNQIDRIGWTNLTADIAAKGGTATVLCNWRAPVTVSNVEMCATINGTVVQRTLTVTASPAPNLQVFSEDIAFSPTLPRSGEPVTVSVRIRNTEGSMATNFQVKFFVNSSGGSWVDLCAPVNVVSLAVGAETTVTAGAVITPSLSAYGVKVEVVPNTTQSDADPGDNAATSSFLLAGTPVARAGADVTCFVGQTVTLDGTGSSNATAYTWTLVDRPTNSVNGLTGAATARPTLTPDQPGRYTVRLLVSAGLRRSEPDTVTVTANWIELMLHPGAYGRIEEQNAGGDYTNAVAYGASFPAVHVTPSTGFVFSAWDPDAPATIVTNVEATARYRPEAAVVSMAAELIRGSVESQREYGLYTEQALRDLSAGPLTITVDPLTGEVQLGLQMEWRDDLATGEWKPLGAPLRWSDTNTVGKAFYRLLLREPGGE